MKPGEPILWSLYIYAPNKGAPIFFTIAYAVSAVFHIWQCYRYKAFKLIGLHPVCAVLFTVGYAMREYGAYNYLYSETTKAPLLVFVLSQVFIYVCPPLLELANYHVLGRIFYYVPYCSPLHPGRVLSTFGGLMVIVETLNALGVSLAVNTSSSRAQQTIGGHLTIAALAIQLGIIIVFICLAALFHWRCDQVKIRSKSVETLLIILYLSMTLIFVRCIYRLVEHTGNTKVDIDDLDALRNLSPLLRYEAYLYVFEATLMLINSILWNVWNPGRFLPQDYHVYLGQDGTEIRGQEELDERSLIAKIMHVATFGLLFGKKRQDMQFQELTEYPTANCQAAL